MMSISMVRQFATAFAAESDAAGVALAAQARWPRWEFWAAEDLYGDAWVVLVGERGEADDGFVDVIGYLALM